MTFFNIRCITCLHISEKSFIFPPWLVSVESSLWKVCYLSVIIFRGKERRKHDEGKKISIPLKLWNSKCTLRKEIIKIRCIMLRTEDWGLRTASQPKNPQKLSMKKLLTISASPHKRCNVNSAKISDVLSKMHGCQPALYPPHEGEYECQVGCAAADISNIKHLKSSFPTGPNF